MKKIACFLVLLLISTAGCVSHTPLPPLISRENMVIESDPAWQDYGAVYSYDEMRIVAAYDQSQNTFSTTYSVNQAIRILDKSGMKYGTIPVRRYEGELQEFDVQLHDANGTSLSLDIPAMKEHYLGTGEIVVPRVQPGCEISLQLKFHDSDSMASHDHIYTKPIPVLKSRFSFLNSYDFRYNNKSYELTDATVEEVALNSLKGFMVTQENIRPISDLRSQKLEFLADNVDFTNLPRTNVQIESFWSPMGDYSSPDWQELSTQFKNFYYSPSMFSSSARLEKITKDLIKYEFEDFQKADTILKYVQDNFTVRRQNYGQASRVNVNSVLRQKAGTPLELSVLLSEMLSIAGLETRHYVTRSPSQGGFDPDVASWSQLQFPIISVIVDGREFIAFPFLRECELGEYPAEIERQYGLELTRGEPARIPQSVHNSGGIQSRVDISLSSVEEGVHSWEYTLADHFAARARQVFKGAGERSLKKTGQTILSKYEDRHELFTITRDPLYRGDDIVLQMKFENDYMSVVHGNDTAVSLSPYFRKYFTSFFESDGVSFNNDLEMVFEEEVRLSDILTDTANLVFPCEEIDNVLFNTKCSKEEYEGEFVVGRTLLIKKAELSRAELQQLLPDIKRLNRISESQVTYTR